MSASFLPLCVLSPSGVLFGMPGPSNAAEPSGRERRPSEKVVQLGQCLFICEACFLLIMYLYPS
jgi:hypothetical protein